MSILILASEHDVHIRKVKEILEQNMEKLKLYVPEDEIGVYSASAKRKDINKYNFATIQSIYKKPELFRHIGLVLVDECHQVNPKNAAMAIVSSTRVGMSQMRNSSVGNR